MRGPYVVVLVAILMGASAGGAQTRAPRPRSNAVMTQQAGNWKGFKDPFSWARGDCPDCREGESMAQAVVAVPPSAYVDVDDPPCGDPQFNAPGIPGGLKAQAAEIFRAQGRSGEPPVYALGFDDPLLARLVKTGVTDAWTLGQLTRAFTKQPQVASCARAVVVYPRATNVTRIDARMDCPAGGWCRNGQPTVDDLGGDLRALSSTGKNWSHNRDATMILKVYYRR